MRKDIQDVERATGEEVDKLVNRGLVSLDFAGYDIIKYKVIRYDVSITKRGREVLGDKVKDFEDSLIFS